MKYQLLFQRSTIGERSERGQSLVELTLFVPILILLLAGFVEIGVLINGYITALDASRASARYVSPLDPKLTRCQPFGPDSDPTHSWITPFTSNCTTGVIEYPPRAAEVKSWDMAANGTTYDRCKTSPTVNFFYVAGCLALLNLPRGGLNPITQTIWTANDYAGDDIVVTTIPIKDGQPVYDDGLLWWSLYGNQPTPAFPSFVVNPTGAGTFTIKRRLYHQLEPEPRRKLRRRPDWWWSRSIAFSRSSSSCSRWPTAWSGVVPSFQIQCRFTPTRCFRWWPWSLTSNHVNQSQCFCQHLEISLQRDRDMMLMTSKT